MTQLRGKKRELVAHHEAAHAVITRHLGVRVQSIMMFPRDGGMEAAGAVTESAAHFADDAIEAKITGLEIDAKIALAGVHANVAFTGKARYFLAGTASDMQQAESASSIIALLKTGKLSSLPTSNMQADIDQATHEMAKSILLELEIETKQLVADHWPAIQRIAGALMTRDLLAEDEVDRLIADDSAKPSAALSRSG